MKHHFGKHLFGLLLLTLIGVGCAVDDKTVIQQANDTHLQLEAAVITDRQLEEYVQKIGDRMVAEALALAQSGYEEDRVYKQDPGWMFEGIEFHLVNSDTLNAFTTGGKHVYLYSELFTTSKTEDEFAAVVGHEFAHIFGRHVSNGMQRQYGIMGAALAAGVAGYALGGDNAEEVAMLAASGTMVGGQFIGAGFSRGDEDEADKFGFKFYVHAGYDPDLFPGFFQQMIEKGYDTSDPMASHPQLSKRVENARRRAAEWRAQNPDWQRYRRPNIATPSQFAAFQARAKQVGKNMPSDKTLETAKLMLAAFPSCVAPMDQKSQVEARKKVGAILEQQAH
ncbi:MAG TPA: M48 family metalloprotease [Tepidisphaeraceae bacterium]|nr:M48 family metalloprotease [Tepidisphaeraceae bacterium]